MDFSLRLARAAAVMTWLSLGVTAVAATLMTSRGEDTARQAGLDAGASAYLLKNEFDQEQLVNTVRRLVGR